MFFLNNQFLKLNEEKAVSKYKVKTNTRDHLTKSYLKNFKSLKINFIEILMSYI